MITQKELKEHISYNRKTGKFRWRIRKNGRPLHGFAGTLLPNGYIDIRINKLKFKAHRLAWFYVKGEFPKNQIDHINGVRNDNRWRNLRVVTSQQNNFNRISRGYYRNGNRFRVCIYLNGKSISVGSYASEIDAKKAHQKAKIKYHGKEFSGRVLNE